jgi:hypothetical protein
MATGAVMFRFLAVVKAALLAIGVIILIGGLILLLGWPSMDVPIPGLEIGEFLKIPDGRFPTAIVFLLVGGLIFFFTIQWRIADREGNVAGRSRPE